MLTLKRLLSLLAFLALAISATACIANPTPHPGSEDQGDLSMAESAPGGAMAAEEEPMAGAPEGSLDESVSVDNAPSVGDAGAEPADGGATEDSGPDPEADPCDAPLDAILEALPSYQVCEADEECQLFASDNTCECARGLAVSDLEGAQALLGDALECADNREALLGACASDVAPTDVQAVCVSGRCTMSVSEESCLAEASADGDDASEEVGDATVDEEVGPDSEASGDATVDEEVGPDSEASSDATVDEDSGPDSEASVD